MALSLIHISLDACGAEFVRDVEPGEIVIVDQNGVRSMKPDFGDKKKALCLFAVSYTHLAVYKRQGKKELVEMCAYRLTTPGTGKEIGATLNANRELFMGAYHAPHVTGLSLIHISYKSACKAEFYLFY